MERDFLRQEIFSRYGTIKRARGCFLYTAKNVRLTDLYLEDGRAILGWGEGSAVTMLKNALSRGITGTYVTDFSYRMEKAVSDLLGSKRKVLVFPTKKDALEAAVFFSKENTSVWKPWLSAKVEWSAVDSVVIQPPFAWEPGVFLLALTPSLCDGSSFKEVRSSSVSAPLAAAVCRSLYDMKAALCQRSENDWFLWDKVLCRYFERRGPYLYVKRDVVSESDFPRFVLHMLDCGVVINPCYNGASIVPYGADRGVFTLLKNNPFDSARNGGETA